MFVKDRTFSGVVCEQRVYFVSDRILNIKTAEPQKPRFKTEEERFRHRWRMARRKHVQLFNENFSPTSLYSTLTFDDEHEVHTLKEARKIRDNYYKRLKYYYPDSVIFLYMGRGKSTDRIHFHMVSEGIPQVVIENQWYYGDIKRIVNLRKKNYYEGKYCGQDYTGLANYLFDHWTKEQGGHYYKKSKNAKKPEREAPVECIRRYCEDKPPRPPKGYIFVESRATEFGYLYFKYIKDTRKSDKKNCKDSS